MRKKRKAKPGKIKSFFTNWDLRIRTAAVVVAISTLLFGIYKWVEVYYIIPARAEQEQLVNLFVETAALFEFRSSKICGMLYSTNSSRLPDSEKAAYLSELEQNNKALNSNLTKISETSRKFYGNHSLHAHDVLACFMRYVDKVTSSPTTSREACITLEYKAMDYLKIEFQNALNEPYDGKNKLRYVGHVEHDKALKCTGYTPDDQQNTTDQK